MPLVYFVNGSGAILEANRKQPGHVFNLGHGVLPGTPVESVKAMVAAVKQYG